MREIRVSKNNITRLMLSKLGDKNINIAKSEAVYVDTFDMLVKEVAELSYLNQDYMLFYRGQSKDYHNKSDATTLYPTIYRGERISKNELRYKFDNLKTASSMLVDKISKYKKDQNSIIGVNEVKSKRHIQWSILQHYEVCETPLIDVTHSLRVACSFAFLDTLCDYAYIYILALPYLTGRISINSEHDLVNIRLISIAPPQALRPYFQEGYLVGTEFIHDDYIEKNELDFNRRLVAKYKIPNSRAFWGNNLSAIDKKVLYPENDLLLDICKEIKLDINSIVVSNESAGEFLLKWNKLNSVLWKNSNRKYSILQNIKYLKENNNIDDNTVKKIEIVRELRNRLVHNTSLISEREILQKINIIDSILADLEAFEQNNSEKIG